MALSKDERKAVRLAIKRVAETEDTSSVMAIIRGCSRFRRSTSGYELKEKFRNFYNEHGCPFADWPRRSERLKTIRILLLETFLIFDGEIMSNPQCPKCGSTCRSGRWGSENT